MRISCKIKMLWALMLLGVTLESSAAEPATGAAPASTTEKVADALAQAKREFIVECRVVSKTRSFSVPKIRVIDGQTANIEETKQTSFGVGVTFKAGALIPVSNVGSEGTTLAVTVVDRGGEKVILDTTVELSSTKDTNALKTDGVKVNPEHSVRLNATKARTIETVSLSKKTTVHFKDFDLEVTVNVAAED